MSLSRPVPDRYLLPCARSALNERLGFTPDPYIQDWDHENSDPDRLGEFLDLYESPDLSEDERFGLMTLIISSFDNLVLCAEDRSEDRTRLRTLLVQDHAIHAYTIDYWCMDGVNDPERLFAVTPFMREIWAACE